MYSTCISIIKFKDASKDWSEIKNIYVQCDMTKAAYQCITTAVEASSGWTTEEHENKTSSVALPLSLQLAQLALVAVVNLL